MMILAIAKIMMIRGRTIFTVVEFMNSKIYTIPRERFCDLLDFIQMQENLASFVFKESHWTKDLSEKLQKSTKTTKLFSRVVYGT